MKVLLVLRGDLYGIASIGATKRVQRRHNTALFLSCLFLYILKSQDKVFTLNILSWLGWRDSNPRMPGPKPGALPLGDIPIPNHFNKYYSKNQVLSWTFFCNFTSIVGYSLEYVSFSNIPVQDFWHIIIPIL